MAGYENFKKIQYQNRAGMFKARYQTNTGCDKAWIMGLASQPAQSTMFMLSKEQVGLAKDK